jgi:hypothetical protein
MYIPVTITPTRAHHSALPKYESQLVLLSIAIDRPASFPITRLYIMSDPAENVQTDT